MWDIRPMKDDDPEKRIRELEQELADVTRTPQSPPPYTESAPYTGGDSHPGAAAYPGSFPSAGSQPYGFGAPPPRRRKPYPWFLVVVGLAVVLPTVISLVMFFARSTSGITTPRFNRSQPTTSTGPTAVPQAGDMPVGVR